MQVRIYDDRLEVWNPGGLPAGMNLDALYHEHPSRPRNKRIAAALYRARLIERWGTGTLRIVEAYTSQGLPPPEFLYEYDTFIARMLPVPLPAAMPDLSDLTDRQRRAIEYVRAHGSITREEYMAQIGVSERQARYDLSALVARGLLIRQGKARSTRYVSALAEM